MFEFRFVKKAIRRSAAKRHRVLNTAMAYRWRTCPNEGASEADMSSARACSPRKMRRQREGVSEKGTSEEDVSRARIGRRRVGVGGACRGRLVGRSRVGGVGVPACSSPHFGSTPAGRAKLRSTAPVSSSLRGHVSAGCF